MVLHVLRLRLELGWLLVKYTSFNCDCQENDNQIDQIRSCWWLPSLLIIKIYRLYFLNYRHLIGLKIEVKVSHVWHLHLVHHVGEIRPGEAFHLHHRLPGCQNVTNNRCFNFSEFLLKYTVLKKYRIWRIFEWRGVCLYNIWCSIFNFLCAKSLK